MVSDIRNGQMVRIDSLDHYIYVMITSDLSLSHGIKHLFIVDWFIVLLRVDLKRWSVVLEFVVKLWVRHIWWLLLRLKHTHFQDWWFSILNWWNWVWILKILWTRWIRRTSWLNIGLGGGESPLTLWRVEIILEIIVTRLGIWVILIRIRPIRHTRLVKVMICWVGNIQKRGRACNMDYH